MAFISKWVPTYSIRTLDLEVYCADTKGELKHFPNAIFKNWKLQCTFGVTMGYRIVMRDVVL
jgi:hypothetical protein